MPGTPGRSGRKPTPNHLKVLSGSRRARKPESLPQPTEGAPTCPSWLTAEAKAEWRRVVPELERLKLLSKIDRGALASYCEAWSTLKAATGEVQKYGISMIVIERELDDGTRLYAKVAKNPAVVVARDAMASIRSFCSEFGLTPSARSRMPVKDAPTNTRNRLLS